MWQCECGVGSIASFEHEQESNWYTQLHVRDRLGAPHCIVVGWLRDGMSYQS